MIVDEEIARARLDLTVEHDWCDQSLERGGAGVSDLVGLDDLTRDHGQIEVAAEHLRHRIGDRVEARCFVGNDRK
ncbi:MAG TPA: hypothetical protein VF638_04640 [Sphingomonas sp.]|jgi:hypothetical protein